MTTFIDFSQKYFWNSKPEQSRRRNNRHINWEKLQFDTIYIRHKLMSKRTKNL